MTLLSKVALREPQGDNFSTDQIQSSDRINSIYKIRGKIFQTSPYITLHVSESLWQKNGLRGINLG
jgi:hypothetical protein